MVLGIFVVGSEKILHLGPWRVVPAASLRQVSSAIQGGMDFEGPGKNRLRIWRRLVHDSPLSSDNSTRVLPPSVLQATFFRATSISISCVGVAAARKIRPGFSDAVMRLT
jgi:hypothetical protein